MVILEALTHGQLVLVDSAGALARDIGGADVHEPLQALTGRAKLEDVASPLHVDPLSDSAGTARS
jgi:hypothetical protein